MRTAPRTPPTKWTARTSSESSNLSLNFTPTARAQKAPAATPITVAPSRLTKPQAGVMATRPATAPDAAPRGVDFPSLTFSTPIQASRAAAVAVLVLRNAWAARLLAPSADPALKPNQPNHRMPAPSTVKGTLCGSIEVPGQPLRLPATSANPAP